MKKFYVGFLLLFLSTAVQAQLGDFKPVEVPDETVDMVVTKFVYDGPWVQQATIVYNGDVCTITPFESNEDTGIQKAYCGDRYVEIEESFWWGFKFSLYNNASDPDPLAFVTARRGEGTADPTAIAKGKETLQRINDNALSYGYVKNY